MKINKIDLVFVYVTDLEHSISFYRDVLGMDMIYRSAVWAEFLSGETRFALWKKEQDFLAQHSHVFLSVDDIAGVCAELERREVEITFPPTSYFYGTVAEIMDPDGNVVGLYERCERKPPE